MSEHRLSNHLLSNHLSKDEMIQLLYGLDSGAGHLATCSQCRSVYQTLQIRKSAFTAIEEIPSSLLAAQRRAVYSRMGERPRSFHAWVPALATAALLAIGVYVYQPVTHSTPKSSPATQAEVGDAQLFSEAVSIEQTAEPRAVAPIRGLFEGSE